MSWRTVLIWTGVIAAATAVAAQTNVTTSGGTTNTVPVFSGTSTVGNSPIAVSGSNVGIGTTNPQSLLQLYQTSMPALTMSDATLGAEYGGAVRGYGISGWGGVLDLGTLDALVFNQAIEVYPQAGAIAFLTNSGTNGSTAERMRILANGNIGIGTTNPARKLHIAGDVQIDGNLYFGSNSQPQSALCGLYRR